MPIFHNIKINRITTIVIAGLLLLLVAQSATPQSKQILKDEPLVEALRGGGYSLYFRHAATNWSQHDNVRQRDDWLSCDSDRMRQLSEAGRATSSTIGKSIKALGIPIGKILASPYCRTVETAKLMQLGEVEATAEVMNLRSADYFGGRTAIVDSARTLLSTLPAKSTNTIIVAHGNVAQAATPIYPGEGEAVVFQADGQGGFRYVGRLNPEDWSRLAKSMNASGSD